jgi:hypothetical protein
MRLTIANISNGNGLSAPEFQAAVRAIQRQVTEDFQPEWNVSATLRGTALNINNRVPLQGVHDAIIYVGDSSQDPNTGVANALGYHTAVHKNIPFGFVYLDVCEQYGQSWTVTLSHEVLELLGDPTAVMTVAGPDPKGGGGSVYFDLEVCDPTQGDSYPLDGVGVSNFVGRSYFGIAGGSDQTNFLRLELDPFGVRPQGYFQYESDGASHQVQGDRLNPRQMAARKLLDVAVRNAQVSGRRNTRRDLRLRHPKE